MASARDIGLKHGLFALSFQIYTKVVTILITVDIYFQVKCTEKQEDGIEETVHYIMNVVTAAYRQNKNKPICYIKLVMNLDSFEATVENIFHVSFLVKDGYVNISCGVYICSM
jgi:hypothetical protein